MAGMLGRLRRSVDRRGKGRCRFECVFAALRALERTRVCYSADCAWPLPVACRATVEVIGLSAWPKGLTNCCVQLVRSVRRRRALSVPSPGA